MEVCEDEELFEVDVEEEKDEKSGQLMLLFTYLFINLFVLLFVLLFKHWIKPLVVLLFKLALICWTQFLLTL